jgi:CRP/FNR family transcriptional activator FtrB
MLATMSLRLRMLIRQIAELKLKTTAQRLGSFLLTMVEAETGRAELRFPYDKRLVADQLGMKPESLSRALAKLAKQGVESLPDNLVVIARVERLRAFCAEDEVG